MTYCARFGNFKLCNYRRKSGLVACDSHSAEIPQSSYPEGVNHFPQSYISQLHRTTMRHGSAAGGVTSITTSAGQLYDLRMLCELEPIHISQSTVDRFKQIKFFYVP